MSTKASLQYSRSAGRQRRLALDPVILVTVGALLLAGLVMVSSASLSVAEGLHENLYFHFERQPALPSGRARILERCLRAHAGSSRTAAANASPRCA